MPRVMFSSQPVRGRHGTYELVTSFHVDGREVAPLASRFGGCTKDGLPMRRSANLTQATVQRLLRFATKRLIKGTRGASNSTFMNALRGVSPDKEYTLDVEISMPSRVVAGGFYIISTNNDEPLQLFMGIRANVGLCVIGEALAISQVVDLMRVSGGTKLLKITRTTPV